jgi:Dihydroorotate dehydrogenase
MSKLLNVLNKEKKAQRIKKPIFIKISPDIEEKDISSINELIIKNNIEGIIISNTSDSNRENLIDSKKNEKGGLSGQPIKNLSTSMIKKFYKENKGKISIIGVGGVDSGLSAFEKICAGASAVQLYTGMVYKGPSIVNEIKKSLIEILKKEKIKNITDAVGINS